MRIVVSFGLDGDEGTSTTKLVVIVNDNQASLIAEHFINVSGAEFESFLTTF